MKGTHNGLYEERKSAQHINIKTATIGGTSWIVGALLPQGLDKLLSLTGKNEFASLSGHFADKIDSKK